MRKIYLVLLTFSLVFLFQSCVLVDPFLNDTEIHNKLVIKLDDLCEKEALFNNEYKTVFDTEDIDLVILRFEDFKASFIVLDNYFKDSWFESSQNIFVSEYNDYYHDFMVSYLDSAELFVNSLNKDGLNVANLESILDELDRYTLLFYDYHNRLSDTVNSQVLEIE